MLASSVVTWSAAAVIVSRRFVAVTRSSVKRDSTCANCASSSRVTFDRLVERSACNFCSPTNCSARVVNRNNSACACCCFSSASVRACFIAANASVCALTDSACVSFSSSARLNWALISACSVYQSVNSNTKRD